MFSTHAATHCPVSDRHDLTSAALELESPGCLELAIIACDADTGALAFAGTLGDYVASANPWDIDLGELLGDGFTVMGGGAWDAVRVELAVAPTREARSSLRGFWFAARIACESALVSARADLAFELADGLGVEAHWARLRVDELAHRARTISRRLSVLSAFAPST